MGKGLPDGIKVRKLAGAIADCRLAKPRSTAAEPTPMKAVLITTIRTMVGKSLCDGLPSKFTAEWKSTN